MQLSPIIPQKVLKIVMQRQVLSALNLETSAACAERSLRCCSPTCCTGTYNVQSKRESKRSPSWLNIFRLHASAPLLCNYACNWHTESYLYRGACCPTAMNLLIGAAAFLGQTVDHRHAQTQIFSFCLPHSQMLPLGKVMHIIRLVAPLPPHSKYKHDS